MPLFGGIREQIRRMNEFEERRLARLKAYRFFFVTCERGHRTQMSGEELDRNLRFEKNEELHCPECYEWVKVSTITDGPLMSEDQKRQKEEPSQLSWTKHSDWQFMPRAVAENIPVCPLCKKRTKWEVRDRFGWTTRGYEITCTLCGAGWEYRSTDWSKASHLLSDLVVGVSVREFKITDDDSIWVLTSTGSNQQDKVWHDESDWIGQYDRYLGKEVNVSTWKQMAGSCCGKCGIALSIEEEYCPNCGAKKE